MQAFAIPQPFKERLEYLLFERFDASEKVIRRYHIWTQMGLLFGVVLFLSEYIFTKVPLLGYVGLTLMIFCLALLILYFTVKKVKNVILLKEIGLQFIVFYFVYHSGGLLTCGGLILVGIVPVIISLIFKNFRWMILAFSIYISSVVLLALLDQQLPGKDVFSPGQNLVFWAIGLSVTTLYVFVIALLVQKIYTNLERREAERQKEISDAKTRLYANMTHEFRTPLTVILGLADSAKNTLHGNDQVKMDTIIKNGKSLLQLVDQLLDLGKLESGRLSVNKISANIIPFLKYVFQLQEFYAEEKNISMRFSSERQSYKVDFDPEKLASIVSNLLSNAIKFTPDGGQISMKVHHKEDYIYMEIKDNGIGIPAEKQETIFDRFYQVDGESTRKEGGAGIGLAITRELVELLEGTIEVISKPGVGTVFSVRLPYQPVTGKSVAMPEVEFANGTTEISEVSDDARQPGTGGLERLLIIEDNADVVGYLKACYQNHFSIHVAQDGKEGYLLAVEEIPDIIISDIMMPEMDGITLCKNLKDDYRTSHIPIILLTAKSDIPSRIEGLEKGADAYIVKPFNQRELLVRMQKLLELRRKLFSRYSSGNGFEFSSDPAIRKEDIFFKKLNEIIVRNLGNESFNIQVLCNEMAMSKSQLYRKFSALTNISAAKYIRTLRMKKAKELLQSTSMNITEIGYLVGMKSIAVFSKLFKEEFGYSPTEFVQQNALHNA